ncbi:YicC/YloC family endoribonuclease, partial [Acinetobacter baumannii]
VTINTDLAKAYYQPVSDLADSLGLDKGDILSTLLKLPDVITPSNEMLTEEEWSQTEDLLKEAIAQINKHRLEEGKS